MSDFWMNIIALKIKFDLIFEGLRFCIIFLLIALGLFIYVYDKWTKKR